MTASLREPPLRGSPGRGSVLSDRQRELKDRAPGRIGARLQSSAVPFYDRATDRQLESQGIRLGRVEGLEEISRAAGANPGPESRTATSTSSDSFLLFVISNSRDPSLVATPASASATEPISVRNSSTSSSTKCITTKASTTAITRSTRSRRTGRRLKAAAFRILCRGGRS